eukprot:CAMPEP_0197651758 /NCGR_PEP_ID=MMETSP1338-20131121/34013_1 /TAXON_ID=43686 ORGANISM="Pelagodinium beii, Strain RCC1491" /NCGR_SAMPLE_ID=MMETSP1338 /ASSEMBLY_ACC=CAM_ASM_000754 /LENGTH=444 /DNA_ID=CAMNT_0043226489 /DNA_START=47 /DNA_END=1381 /DNA_ORIENTATION=+
MPPSGANALVAVPPPGPLVSAGKASKSKFEKASKKLLQEHCKSDVSEEWKKVDDSKIAKLRGILSALQEENQSTQLLKKESEDKEAWKALESTRKSVDTRLAFCKEKEALFKKRQEDLRRHVLENQKSLQELESTIEKSEKKVKDEQMECKRHDAEINALNEELRQKEQSKNTESAKITKTQHYKSFLEEVMQETQEEFDGDIEVLINRYATLEAGSQELIQANDDLSVRLDRVRDECLRVQTKLQNEHLMISSQLHVCQVDLEHHQAESAELEQKLNRALEDKELKESQVGVIQMAIEQLFTRTVTSCRLKQRKKAMLDAVDIKYAPVRGDKSDARLEEMFKQIIERVEDLQDMHEQALAALGRDTKKEDDAPVEELDLMDRVKFVQTKGDDIGRVAPNNAADDLLGGQPSSLRTRQSDQTQSAATSGGTGSAGRQDTFLTQE